jgi:DNA-binding IclR family transcriptional regulator
MQAPSKGIQSIEIGYRLLGCFLAAPGPHTLTSLAVASGMTPTKAHFYLTSLVRVGLLAKNGDRTYSLGPSVLQLGLKALAQIDVLGAAREAMIGLRDALRADVFLSVWGDGAPSIVHRILGARPAAWELRIGAVLPPLSGTGRAFLAFLPDAIRHDIIAAELRRAVAKDPWYGLTEQDVRDACDLIRRQRLSSGGGNLIPGYTSIASPILDHEGSAKAVITVNGEIGHFDTAASGEAAKMLLAATSRISREIGRDDASGRGLQAASR